MEDNPYFYTPEGEVEIEIHKSDFFDAAFGFFHVFTYEIATVLARPFHRIITQSNEHRDLFREDGKYRKPIASLLILGNIAIAFSVPLGLFAFCCAFLRSIEFFVDKLISS